MSLSGERVWCGREEKTAEEFNKDFPSDFYFLASRFPFSRLHISISNICIEREDNIYLCCEVQKLCWEPPMLVWSTSYYEDDHLSRVIPDAQSFQVILDSFPLQQYVCSHPQSDNNLPHVKSAFILLMWWYEKLLLVCESRNEIYRRIQNSSQMDSFSSDKPIYSQQNRACSQ